MRQIVALAVALLAASAAAAPANAAPSTENVYALCTVRDVTVADNRIKGKLYRSGIFSAPAKYDSAISMTPGLGGAVSKQFEKWVWETHGLRADRMRLGEGDEHYCIEAPLTIQGKDSLSKLITDWDNSQFPEVELVRTDWEREKSAADRKFDADLAKYEQAERARLAAVEEFERAKAANEEKKARDTAAAQAALDQYAADRAAAEATAAAVAAENERRRQAYREEYRKATGRYPDE